ncbi:MAG: polymerase sigma-70 factor, subfamily [Acidobacteriota bacterium]|jgi:RNA polymerase sigma-70 factor (ECF subfamily)|nr:polymerase sigma-70 factor, subfamily [Acidobacteriota bacterium]MDT7777836.1 polymerase sigma-70 factor, subfamily [Acidobacteriota bacterium]
MIAQAVSFKNVAAVADTDLVLRALAGREDSFEELVRRYQRPIVAYVYRMVGDYDSALDLAQEVFIKVYNSLGRYRSEFKFSTWIYRIAHNAAIDYLRRQGSFRTEGMEVEGEGGQLFEKPLASKAPTPEQETERGERRAEIEEVVRQLPSAYRELIVLRHSHDLSYDEIAEVTGLPLGTVKNRIFRARECMRELLVERGITGM